MKLVDCEPGYWQFVRQLRTDERTQHGFFSHVNISEQEQEIFMQKNSHNYKVCIIDETPVGYVGLIKGREITYCTHPDYNNQGIGSFMVQEFSKLYKNIEALVKVENVASQRVFEKLGWEKKILFEKKSTNPF